MDEAYGFYLDRLRDARGCRDAAYGLRVERRERVAAFASRVRDMVGPGGTLGDDPRALAVAGRAFVEVDPWAWVEGGGCRVAVRRVDLVEVDGAIRALDEDGLDLGRADEAVFAAALASDWPETRRLGGWRGPALGARGVMDHWLLPLDPKDGGGSSEVATGSGKSEEGSLAGLARLVHGTMLLARDEPFAFEHDEDLLHVYGLDARIAEEALVAAMAEDEARERVLAGAPDRTGADVPAGLAGAISALDRGLGEGREGRDAIVALRGGLVDELARLPLRRALEALAILDRGWFDLAWRMLADHPEVVEAGVVGRGRALERLRAVVVATGGAPGLLEGLEGAGRCG